MSHRSRLGRSVAFATAAALLFGWSNASVIADEANNGPGFLLVSVTEAFSVPDVHLHCQASSDGCCHDNRCGCRHRKRNDKKQCACVLPAGSRLVIVPIGTFIAGYDVRNTYFESFGDVTSDALAALIGELGGIESLNGHASTIFGSVDTTGPNSIHLLTPDPGTVPPEVQEAVFFASPELLALPQDDPLLYPQTTVDLANFIFTHQAPLNFSPEIPPANLQQILDFLFLSDTPPLECTTCEAEGSLFPHDPEPDNPLLSYTLKFDENGHVNVEGCTLVHVDVKPGNDPATDPINLGSQGQTPLVVLSSTGVRSNGHGGTETVVFFDPADIDPDTVTLGAEKEHGATDQDWTGAVPINVSYDDLNDDGVDDLILHFYTQDLADPDLGGLTEDTTVLELHGLTSGQGCVHGTDTVRVVPQ